MTIPNTWTPWQEAITKAEVGDLFVYRGIPSSTADRTWSLSATILMGNKADCKMHQQCINEQDNNHWAQIISTDCNSNLCFKIYINGLDDKQDHFMHLDLEIEIMSARVYKDRLRIPEEPKDPIEDLIF